MTYLPQGFTNGLIHSVLGRQTLGPNILMLFPWTGQNLICLTFSPQFSLIAGCLSEVTCGASTRLVGGPLWPSQPWMGILLQLLIDFPHLITDRRKVLTHPTTLDPHPVMSPASRMACRLLGNTLQNRGVLPAAADIAPCLFPGNQVLSGTTAFMSRGGRFYVVVDGMAIPLMPLKSLCKCLDRNLYQGCGLCVCGHCEGCPVFSEHRSRWMRGRQSPFGRQIYKKGFFNLRTLPPRYTH